MPTPGPVHGLRGWRNGAVVHLRSDSLKWALAHVERFGDTDIFPAPFEYEVIRREWSSLLPLLEATDLSSYPVGEIRQALTPKSRYGFRLATQLHPIDCLLFSALVYEIAKDLERYRSPKNDRKVMSHRVSRNANGQLYDPAWNFENFKATLRERCSEPHVQFVVMADIADFYTRIYHHPLQNTLRRAAGSRTHADAVMDLLGQWSLRESYGIPVGPATTRILAELSIADIDKALVAEGIDHCRFSDDFRLFAPSERDAFHALSVLARYLQDLGLTLSERKTDIIPADRFVERHLDGGRPGDAAQLSDRVAQILERHGRPDDLYAMLAVEELPPAMVTELDALDLNAVLREEIRGERRMYDWFAVSIALRRLAQLEDASLLDLVVDNVDHLIPVLPQVVAFLRKATPTDRRPSVGARLIEVMSAGLSSHVQYQCVWLLSLFAYDESWGNGDGLQSLVPELADDDVSGPMLTLALGAAGAREWFRPRRRQLQSMGGWQRRSFLRGAKCMSDDELSHWLNAVRSRLDTLDGAVATDGLRNR